MRLSVDVLGLPMSRKWLALLGTQAWLDTVYLPSTRKHGYTKACEGSTHRCKSLAQHTALAVCATPGMELRMRPSRAPLAPSSCNAHVLQGQDIRYQKVGMAAAQLESAEGRRSAAKSADLSHAKHLAVEVACIGHGLHIGVLDSLKLGELWRHVLPVEADPGTLVLQLVAVIGRREHCHAVAIVLHLVAFILDLKEESRHHRHAGKETQTPGQCIW